MASWIFPHPSSNDSADKLNYKWMLMLMLLLSVVSFIIPLHPFCNSDNSQETTSPSSPGPFTVQNLKPVTIPTFKAVCWTPDAWPSPQFGYASAYCSKEYNAAIRGQSDKSVYRVITGDYIPISSKGLDPIKPMTPDSNPTEEGGNHQYVGPDPRIIAVNEFKERVRKLVVFQAPVTFLIMAVCLGLSQVVWSFLSECCGSFNAGETIELVGRQSESRAFDDVSEYLGQCFTRWGRSMGLLYLFKKFLSLVFVLSLILLAVAYALPEVNDLHDEFSKLSSTEYSAPLAENATNVNINRDKLPQNNADGFLCDFKIRSMLEIKSYTIQCIPVIDKDNTMDDPSFFSSSNPNAATPSSTNPSSAVKTLLNFESLMLQIAVAILVILFVNNLFSLCAWLVILMSGSTKARVGLHDTASMDLVFLVHMSRINSGGQVAHIIARSSSGAKI